MTNWKLNETRHEPVEIGNCAKCKAAPDKPHMLTLNTWHVPSRTRQGCHHTVLWEAMWEDWKCTCEGDYWHRMSQGKRAKCSHVKRVIWELQARYTPDPAPVKRAVTLLDLFE